MPAPLGPYTPAVVANGFVYTSGQLGLAGDELADGLEAQVRHGIANLSALLDEHGASLNTVVKTTVFLTRLDDIAGMNDVYASAFASPCPARSTVEIDRLPNGMLVEIECTALA